jgi:hypothetical protein
MGRNNNEQTEGCFVHSVNEKNNVQSRTKIHNKIMSFMLAYVHVGGIVVVVVVVIAFIIAGLLCTNSMSNVKVNHSLTNVLRGFRVFCGSTT